MKKKCLAFYFKSDAEMKAFLSSKLSRPQISKTIGNTIFQISFMVNMFYNY